jgi:GxxExxY protein
MNHRGAEAQSGQERDPLTHAVIGAAIEVHWILGPGLLESDYEQCLHYELGLRGIEAYRQVGLPIAYKDLKAEDPFRKQTSVHVSVPLRLCGSSLLLPLSYAASMISAVISSISRVIALSPLRVSASPRERAFLPGAFLTGGLVGRLADVLS